MKRKMWRFVLIFAISAFAIIISSPALSGQTTIHRYRYKLLTRTGDRAYAGEVPSKVSGGFFEVETDAKGRKIRVASMRHGEKESEWIYHFATESMVPNEYEEFTSNQKTGIGKFQRNTKGEITRLDNFTATGSITGYIIYSRISNDVERTSYTPEGKAKSVIIISFSSNGNLIHSIGYFNPEDRSHHTDVEYDESTGQEKTAKQMIGDKVSISRSSTFNADGDYLRIDALDGDTGKLLYYIEFTDNLETRRVYTSAQSAGEEIRTTYDEKHWRKESDLFFNNTIVCRLVYEWLPDGMPKRTLALGPTGDLWAEYPDAMVADLTRDGHPVLHTPAVIHKTGNWW